MARAATAAALLLLPLVVVVVAAAAAAAAEEMRYGGGERGRRLGRHCGGGGGGGGGGGASTQIPLHLRATPSAPASLPYPHQCSMAVAVANGIPRARRPTAAADLATSPLACPYHLVCVFLGASSDVARGGSRAARGASAGTA
ncbi:hypothetical protein OsI_31057 [Oryza sativa Indica Group]|uniref:Uncharacterized protein n=1 Tax=Oryza sativa subsp. indica TaxID=39946 RepID=B8BET4_ORYSI|nr:hypothetical protein OsI_31057 [Oryza sativa Indica Group]